jgi:hypothetical protein
VLASLVVLMLSRLVSCHAPELTLEGNVMRWSVELADYDSEVLHLVVTDPHTAAKSYRTLDLPPHLAESITLRTGDKIRATFDTSCDETDESSTVTCLPDGTSLRSVEILEAAEPGRNLNTGNHGHLPTAELVTPTTYKTLIMLLDICGAGAAITEEDLNRVLFRTAGSVATTVQDVFEGCSYQQAAFTSTNVKIVGPIPIPCKGTSRSAYDYVTYEV